MLHAAEQQRDDVQEKREAWRNEMPQLDPGRLVFVDECATQDDMTPRYGRAPVGERVVEGVPTAGWTIKTLLAALRLDGHRAPMVLEGAVDGAAFLAWVKQVLVPTLRPGDIVIWDNLRSHQVAGVAEALAQAKATLKPLPPYSPDLNPIEKMWSKVKEFLRRAKARGLQTLLRAIKRALASVTAEDAAAWFACCGYRHTIP
jgi:transposase